MPIEPITPRRLENLRNQTHKEVIYVINDEIIRNYDSKTRAAIIRASVVAERVLKKHPEFGDVNLDHHLKFYSRSGWDVDVESYPRENIPTKIIFRKKKFSLHHFGIF
jgi:hypothetical protein